MSRFDYYRCDPDPTDPPPPPVDPDPPKPPEPPAEPETVRERKSGKRLDPELEFSTRCHPYKN